MKNIEVSDRPCVMCPISKKWQMINKCHNCDAYKGQLEGPIDQIEPTYIKCEADEY